MRAALHRLLSFQVRDLPTWTPGSGDFAIGVRLIVGPQDEDGEESFDLTVCSPGWLQAKVRESSIYDGRHHLIVDQFDFPKLEAYLRDRVESCQGESWDQIAHQLSRLGYWEFEDYYE